MYESAAHPVTQVASRKPLALVISRATLAALALMLFSTLFYLKIGQDFERLQISAQYDVLFDTDPNTRLACFATGWGSGRSIAHPNLCNLVNPPVRLGAALLIKLGLVEDDTDQARRQLALLVAPMVGGLTVALLFVSLLVLGVRLAPATALSALYAVSFSQFIFAGIPEHFVMGSFAIGSCLLLLAASLRDQPLHPALWVLAGFLCFSVTTTNFFVFLLLLGLALWHSEGPRMWRSWLKLGVLAVGVAMLFKLPLDLRYGGGTDIGSVVGFAQDWLRKDGARGILLYPRALVEAIVAPLPSIIDNWRLAPDGSGYPFKFWLEGGRYSNPFSLVAATLVGAFLLGGLAKGWQLARSRSSERLLCLGIFGVLLYNGLFHGVWGDQLFLYSQHWLFASFLLMALLLREQGAFAKANSIAIAICAMLTLAGNLQTLSYIVSLLEGGRI